MCIRIRLHTTMKRLSWPCTVRDGACKTRKFGWWFRRTHKKHILSMPYTVIQFTMVDPRTMGLTPGFCEASALEELEQPVLRKKKCLV